MGCDIHAYVEYSDDGKYWSSIGSDMHLNRNYELFGLLAGVRGGEALFAPKGAPEDMGYVAREQLWLNIVDDGSENSADRTVSREKAETWTQYGSKLQYDEHGVAQYVEHPDYHSITWLTAQEYSAVLKKYRHKAVTYKAVAAMMNTFVRNGLQARIILWFDN